MSYFVFFTDQPIKLEQIEPLSKYGVIIPYDSKCADINTYGYYPADADKNTINAIKTLGNVIFTKDQVQLTEIQKQANKIQESNEIKQGDIVYHRDYKKLPFVVTFTDGHTATIFHNLRTRPLTMSADTKLLRLADANLELPVYKVDKPIIELQDKVYIDCDMFAQNNADDYQRTMFITILKLKMIYIRANVVLVNPIQHDRDIATLMGIGAVFGNLLALISKIQPNVLISRSKLTDYNNQYIIEQGRLTKPQYIVDSTTDSQAYIYGLINNKKYIKEHLLRIKNNQALPLECDTPALDTDIVELKPQKIKHRDKLVSQLRAVGLDAFTTRLDDILYFVKGF